MKLRKLLIPTDFSDQSQHSLTYALALARDVQAKLYVLHSYYVPINTIETAYIADQSIWLEQARQAALEEMKMLEDRQLKRSGVPYECMVHPGPVMGDINETIRDTGIDLVVMGTSESESGANFFGDLYIQAIRHAQAPVLLVPQAVDYQRPTEAIFATDLKPLEKETPLQNLHNILESLGVRLELLHVRKTDEALKEKQQTALHTIKKHMASLNPEIFLLESQDIEEGILQHARQRQAQWLVALSHHYGLLEGLFHSSHTKKLARQTSIPLLVSHE